MKTPIAILQELTQSKKLPLPNYQFEQNGMFQCTVTVGEKSARGQGLSKKSAKHDAAKNMLIEFEVEIQEFDNLSETSSTTSIVVPKNVGPFINYIGNLNEFCVKKAIDLPTYHDRSLIQFVVDCKLKHLLETGYGTNRKAAKQEAAKKMLEKLTNSDILALLQLRSKILQNEEIKNEFNKDEIEVVLNKFQSLALRNNNININNINEIDSENETSPPPPPPLANSNNLEITTWEELITYFDYKNYKYKLEVFQENPLVLILKINDHVLMSFGDTKEDIKGKLIKQALEMIKLGYNFKDKQN